MKLHPILNARQRTHNLTVLDDMLSLEAGGKRLDGTSSSQSSNVNFHPLTFLLLRRTTTLALAYNPKGSV
jgi:hypothetical protein